MDLAGRQPDLVLQVAVRAERAHHRRLPPLPAPLHPPQAGLPAQLALRRPPPPSRRRSAAPAPCGPPHLAPRSLLGTSSEPSPCRDAAPRRVPPRPPHRVARRGAAVARPVLCADGGAVSDPSCTAFPQALRCTIRALNRSADSHAPLERCTPNEERHTHTHTHTRARARARARAHTHTHALGLACVETST